MNTFFIIILLLILGVNAATTFFLYFRQETKEEKEIDIDEELNKATKTISEYCLTRSHKEPCRYNVSGKKNECDCILLKTPPEGWNNANNKK